MATSPSAKPEQIQLTTEYLRPTVGNDGYQLHWKGTGINSTNTQGYTGFNTIYGLSASDIWALGSCCWQDGGSQPWGAHYNGARWTYQETPP
jgi:hypothetical protein